MATQYNVIADMKSCIYPSPNMLLSVTFFCKFQCVCYSWDNNE